jgi:hypothetical protein
VNATEVVILVQEDALAKVPARHDVKEPDRVDLAQRSHATQARAVAAPCHRLWTNCCSLFTLA